MDTSAQPPPPPNEPPPDHTPEALTDIERGTFRNVDLDPPTKPAAAAPPPIDPQARIATLERELAWAHLKIQSLKEELRQYRVKLLGPRSETLSDLQLELLADQEPGTTLDEVGAEAQRPPLPEATRRERWDS